MPGRERNTMYFIYSILLGLGAVLTSPYWLVKGVRERKYLANFRRRLGLSLPAHQPGPRPLWIHAVSVGEVLAAKPLVRSLKSRHPSLPLVVSTVTVTGQALAAREFGGVASVVYFPFDWDFSIRRVLARVRPRAVVLLETELWPNFLKNCSQARIPVFLFNGRISDKSIGRYRRIQWLACRMIRALDRIGAQTDEDRRRLIRLGAAEERVTVTGNLKYDLAAPPIDPGDELLQMIRSALGLTQSSPVIVVGSSMKGEEACFLDAFRETRQRVPGARLILAPRHPERFDEVAGLVASREFAFCRRSELGSGDQRHRDILLLDTIGELRRVYSLATVAVIGGSFLPYGGHNPLEPASLGKAVVFGPEMRNFREMACLFADEKAARQCSAGTLAAVLVELLENEQARALLGQKALSLFRKNQGATENTLRILQPHLAT
jgi:3-deoxy-D-manno-octulosonic-acid transferase